MVSKDDSTNDLSTTSVNYGAARASVRSHKKKYVFYWIFCALNSMLIEHKLKHVIAST